MAEILDSFPPSEHGVRYPWLDRETGEGWLDGQVWRLVPGVDYPKDVARTMRSQVYKAASDRGLSVRVSRQGEALVVQATAKAEPAAA